MMIVAKQIPGCVKNQRSVIHQHESSAKWINRDVSLQQCITVESFIVVNKWDHRVDTELFLNGCRGIKMCYKRWLKAAN